MLIYAQSPNHSSFNSTRKYYCVNKNQLISSHQVYHLQSPTRKNEQLAIAKLDIQLNILGKTWNQKKKTY